MGRIEKVNQQIKREIGTILQREMGDPRFAYVTITRVDTSKDLRSARVYYSVLTQGDDASHLEEGLNRASGLVRRYLGKQMTIRNTPELHFIYDESISAASSLEQTFMEIANEVQEDHQQDQ